jgi:GNAT superfamily N-acetyltransferase
MIHIRNAERVDVKVLVQLIQEMGQHERMAVFASEESLAQDGFGPTPKFRAVIAEVGAEVAGYALFFDCYSSFQGKGIFLEDLFVRDNFRGKGVGRALLSYIAARVIELGYFGIMLNVLDWNQSALQFFEGAGASVMCERKTLSLTGKPLAEIAQHESVRANR